MGLQEAGLTTHPGLERLLLEGVEWRRRRPDGDSLAGHYVDIFSLWGVWGCRRFSSALTPTTYPVVLEALEQLAWRIKVNGVKRLTIKNKFANEKKHVVNPAQH